jgi:hypothetical protein
VVDRNSRACANIQLMPRKPIELQPAVARRFVEDMRAFHAEENAIKRDDGLSNIELLAATHTFVGRK